MNADHSAVVNLKTWKILVVDDDDSVHALTRMVLEDFSYDERSLELIEAYSGEDAVKAVREHPDIALILMDVVMETDTAGLDAVEAIRNQLGRWDIRIVLRTGQPGLAPEREVVTRFDINDYADKSTLTAQKLFTLVYTGLSLFQKIQGLKYSNSQLRQIGLSSRHLFRIRGRAELASHLVNDLVDLYRAQVANQAQPINCRVFDWPESGEPSVLGQHVEYPADDQRDIAAILTATQGPMVTTPRSLIVRSRVGHPRASAVILSSTAPLDHPAEDTLGLFFRQVVVAFENAELVEDAAETQREMLELLGGAIEKRSKETGHHIRRVSEMSALLAREYGLPDDQVEIIRDASPLHDAGKIAIPDAILNKPGKHTAEERAIMQSHAEVGEAMLAQRGRPLLDAASIIAGQHHERWDGMGYPRQLAGEEIHIFGRITAIADVFDALCAERCYKQAWPVEDAIKLLRAERGKHFDPRLVDLFIANLDAVQQIMDRYPD